MSKKIKVVSTKKACELLFECSKQTFYRKYKDQLEPVSSIPNDRNCYYKLEDVLNLKTKIEMNAPVVNYEIIG